MSNIWNDPFGLELMKCNKKPAPPAEPEAPPAASCAPAFQYCCYYGYYPQPIFQQHIYMSNPHSIGPYHPVVAPAPPPPPPSAPSVHQCVVCTGKNKCKACKKKEEESKVWITNPTFCNPRRPRKGVFER